MRSLLFLVVALMLAGCGAASPVAPAEPASGSAPAASTLPSTDVTLHADLVVRRLSPNVLLHVSWKELPEWGRVSSNGLVVMGPHEALLVDTTCDDAGTALLLDHVEAAHGRRVTHAIVTHSHDDRMGGIREAQRRGIVVHGLALTALRAVAAGEPPPSETFASETTLRVDGVRAEAFFPGAAHAPDNLVVWLPDEHVLFGTCMVREQAGTSVGNLADASLETWEAALAAVRARVPAPRVVVPGHGEPGDAGLLDHTLTLVRAARGER